jgi:hypothetical protein
MENNNLEKSIWSEDDFETMQWHDCKIYALAFVEEKHEIAFDLDFILEWLNPREGESNFKFWVVPATLIFRNVYDINISQYSVDFQILDIVKENPTKPKNALYIKESTEYDWTIETTSGQMTFKSVGYNQYARARPRLLDIQQIGLIERGGISFERHSFNP